MIAKHRLRAPLLILWLAVFFLQAINVYATDHDDDGKRLQIPRPLVSAGGSTPPQSVRPRNRVTPDPAYRPSFEKVDSLDIPKVGETGEFFGAIHGDRIQLEAEIKKVSQAWEAKIPDSAYKNGKLDTSDINYKTIKQQWDTEVQHIWDSFDGRNASRLKAHEQIAQTTVQSRKGIKKPLGDMFQQSGRLPETIASDMDLTPLQGSEEAAALYAKASAKQGKRVLEFPDRYVILDTDTTVWKSQTARDLASSSGDWGRALTDTRFMSDKFSTPGGLHYTTNGTRGIYDPEGAVLDNLKKFIDGYRGGNLDDIDWKLLCKSAFKVQKITKLDIDPKLARVLESVRNPSTTLTQADLFTFGAQGDALEAEKLKRVEELMDVISRGYKKAAGMSKQRADHWLKELRNPRLSKTARQNIRAGRADIEFSNAAAKHSLSNQDPELFNKLSGGAKVEKITMPDGSVRFHYNGKTLPKSRLVDLSLQAARDRFKKLFPSYNPKESKFFSTNVRPSMAVADTIIQIAMLKPALERGQAYAISSMKDDENPLWTVTRGTGHGLLDWIGYTPTKQIFDEELDKIYDEQLRWDLEAGMNPWMAYAAAHAEANVRGVGRLLWGMVAPIGELFSEIDGWREDRKDMLESQKLAAEYADKVKEYRATHADNRLLLDQIWALLNGESGDMTDGEFAQLQARQVEAAWEQAKQGDYPDISYAEFKRGYNPYTLRYDPELAARMPPLKKDEPAPAGAGVAQPSQAVDFSLLRSATTEGHRVVNYKLDMGAELEASAAVRWLRHQDTFDPMQLEYTRAPGSSLRILSGGLLPQGMRDSDYRSLLCPDCRDAPAIHVELRAPDGSLLAENLFSLGWSRFTGTINTAFQRKISNEKHSMADQREQRNKAIERGNRNIREVKESIPRAITSAQRSVADRLELLEKGLELTQSSATAHIKVIDLSTDPSCMEVVGTVCTKSNDETSTYCNKKYRNTCWKPGEYRLKQVGSEPRDIPLNYSNCYSHKKKAQVYGQQADALKQQVDDMRKSGLTNTPAFKGLYTAYNDARRLSGAQSGALRQCRELAESIKSRKDEIERTQDWRDAIPRIENKKASERIDWYAGRRTEVVTQADESIMDSRKNVQELMHQATLAAQDALSDDSGHSPPAQSGLMSQVDTEYRVVQARLFDLYRQYKDKLHYQMYFFPAYPLWADQLDRPLAWIKVAKSVVAVNKADDKLLLRFVDTSDDRVLAEYKIPLLVATHWREFRSQEPAKWIALWRGLNQRIGEVAAKHHRRLANHQAGGLLTALKGMYLSSGMMPDRNYFIDAGLGDEFDQTVAYTRTQLGRHDLGVLPLIDHKWEELFSLLTSRFHDLHSRFQAQQAIRKKPTIRNRPKVDDDEYSLFDDPAYTGQSGGQADYSQVAGLVDQFSASGDGYQGGQPGTSGDMIPQGYKQSTAQPQGDDQPEDDVLQSTGPVDDFDDISASGPGGSMVPDLPQGKRPGSAGGGAPVPSECTNLTGTMEKWVKEYRGYFSFLREQGRKRLPYWAPAQLSAKDLATARRKLDHHLAIVKGVLKCVSQPAVVKAMKAAEKTRLMNWAKEQTRKLDDLCKETKKMLQRDVPHKGKKLEDLGIRVDLNRNYWTAQQENCQRLRPVSNQIATRLR